MALPEKGARVWAIDYSEAEGHTWAEVQVFYPGDRGFYVEQGEGRNLRFIGEKDWYPDEAAMLTALESDLAREEVFARKALHDRKERVADARRAEEAALARLRRLRDTRSDVGKRIRALEGKRLGSDA